VISKRPLTSTAFTATSNGSVFRRISQNGISISRHFLIVRIPGEGVQGPEARPRSAHRRLASKHRLVVADLDERSGAAEPLPHLIERTRGSGVTFGSGIEHGYEEARCERDADDPHTDYDSGDDDKNRSARLPHPSTY
jgi:hypothetical protein